MTNAELCQPTASRYLVPNTTVIWFARAAARSWSRAFSGTAWAGKAIRSALRARASRINASIRGRSPATGAAASVISVSADLSGWKDGASMVSPRCSLRPASQNGRSAGCAARACAPARVAAAGSMSAMTRSSVSPLRGGDDAAIGGDDGAVPVLQMVARDAATPETWFALLATTDQTVLRTASGAFQYHP